MFAGEVNGQSEWSLTVACTTIAAIDLLLCLLWYVKHCSTVFHCGCCWIEETVFTHLVTSITTSYSCSVLRCFCSLCTSICFIIKGNNCSMDEWLCSLIHRVVEHCRALGCTMTTNSKPTKDKLTPKTYTATLKLPLNFPKASHKKKRWVTCCNYSDLLDFVHNMLHKFSSVFKNISPSKFWYVTYNYVR